MIREIAVLVPQKMIWQTRVLKALDEGTVHIFGEGKGEKKRSSVLGDGLVETLASIERWTEPGIKQRRKQIQKKEL